MWNGTLWSSDRSRGECGGEKPDDEQVEVFDANVNELFAGSPNLDVGSFACSLKPARIAELAAALKIFIFIRKCKEAVKRPYQQWKMFDQVVSDDASEGSVHAKNFKLAIYEFLMTGWCGRPYRFKKKKKICAREIDPPAASSSSFVSFLPSILFSAMRPAKYVINLCS